jgi:PKD repeat protein
MKYFFISLTLLFLTSCSLVETLTDEGDPPVISELTINPTNGAAPLLSTVSWKIVTTSRESVTCALDFGDGYTETLENCAEQTYKFYTYEKSGGYILVLTARVGRQEVSRSIPITVQDTASNPGNGSAAIALFVTPSEGTAPMLTAVRWELAGMKDPVTCELNFGDGNQETVSNCSQVSDIFHTYEKAGGYVLTLTAKDGERELTKSLPVVVGAKP